MHQLLAVEPDLGKKADALVIEAKATFSKADRFEGQVRKVEMFDLARAKEETTDSKAVVTTVDEKLAFVIPAIVNYFDSLYQKELGNQTAKADLIVDGVVIAKDVPATFLLGMEKRLQATRDNLFLVIPTLDPNLTWSENENLRKGILQSQTIENYKTEKTVEPLVLYPATDKHPAQVKEVSLDRNVGKTVTVKHSGMWSVARKAEVLGKIDALIEGVKRARMVANDAEIPTQRIAKAMLDFVLK